MSMAMKNLSRSLNRLTTDEIEKATNTAAAGVEEKKTRRLNDGGGLTVLIAPNGRAYFQLRNTLAGRTATTQLGIYPAMNLDLAREKATQLRTRLDNERALRRKNANDSSVSQLTSEARNAACVFDSMVRVQRFAFQLLSSISTGTVDREVGVALGLALLVPVQPSLILDAKAGEFDIRTDTWTFQPRISKAKSGKNQAWQIAYLSNEASLLVNAWISGSWRASLPIAYIFPTLAQLSRSERSRRMNSALAKIWPHERIRVEDLRYCFKAMAIKLSLFNPQLIDDAMKSVHPIDRRGFPAYDFQRSSAAGWWVRALDISSDEDPFKACMAALRRSLI